MWIPIMPLDRLGRAFDKPAPSEVEGLVLSLSKDLVRAFLAHRGVECDPQLPAWWRVHDTSRLAIDR